MIYENINKKNLQKTMKKTHRATFLTFLYIFNFFFFFFWLQQIKENKKCFFIYFYYSFDFSKKVTPTQQYNKNFCTIECGMFWDRKSIFLKCFIVIPQMMSRILQFMVDIKNVYLFSQFFLVIHPLWMVYMDG